MKKQPLYLPRDHCQWFCHWVHFYCHLSIFLRTLNSTQLAPVNQNKIGISSQPSLFIHPSFMDLKRKKKKNGGGVRFLDCCNRVHSWNQCCAVYLYLHVIFPPCHLPVSIPILGHHRTRWWWLDEDDDNHSAGIQEVHRLTDWLHCLPSSYAPLEPIPVNTMKGL